MLFLYHRRYGKKDRLSEWLSQEGILAIPQIVLAIGNAFVTGEITSMIEVNNPFDGCCASVSVFASHREAEQEEAA
jgi:hypothetical protein